MEIFTKSELKTLVNFLNSHATVGEIRSEIGSLVDKIIALSEKDGEYDMSKAQCGASGNVNFKVIFHQDARVTFIKLIREGTGFGLKEAKDVSDLGYDPDKEWSELTFKNSSIDFFNRFCKYRVQDSIIPVFISQTS